MTSNNVCYCWQSARMKSYSLRPQVVFHRKPNRGTHGTGGHFRLFDRLDNAVKWPGGFWRCHVSTGKKKLPVDPVLSWKESNDAGTNFFQSGIKRKFICCCFLFLIQFFNFCLFLCCLKKVWKRKWKWALPNAPSLLYWTQRHQNHQKAKFSQK